MGLRDIAKTDLSLILADSDYGFAYLITVTNPAGTSTPSGFTGFSNDISQIIDPDTGEAVSGRSATVALDMTALTAAGFSTLPEAVADEDLKPWIVVFDDIEGSSYTFKVSQSNPDRSLGLVVCHLEAYCDT